MLGVRILLTFEWLSVDWEGVQESLLSCWNFDILIWVVVTGVHICKN